MSEAPTHVRLGDLLMEAGILSSAYIKEALAKYEEQGLPIGKVLVISGYLSDSQLRNALSLQYMVNDRLLKRKDAVEVLKTAHNNGITLEESFRQSGLVQPEEQETNKLGQLLVDSGNLETNDVEECLHICSNTGLPLGHILCYRGLISQPVINKSLLVQQFVRRGQIMRDQGIDCLMVAGQREKHFEALQVNRGYKRQPLKGTPLLGDLLFNAGVISDRQLREALLAHVTTNRTIGRALLDSRQFPEHCINSAVIMQEMIDNNTLEPEKAKEALIEVRSKGISAIRAVAEASTFRLQFNQSSQLLELLSDCGAINLQKLPQEMQQRAEVNYNQVQYVLRGISNIGLCDDTALYGALRLVDLINRGTIDKEKASIALEFAIKSGTDVEYGLFMIGVTERTRLREQDQVLSPLD